MLVLGTRLRLEEENKGDVVSAYVVIRNNLKSPHRELQHHIINIDIFGIKKKKANTLIEI